MCKQLLGKPTMMCERYTGHTGELASTAKTDIAFKHYRIKLWTNTAEGFALLDLENSCLATPTRCAQRVSGVTHGRILGHVTRRSHGNLPEPLTFSKGHQQ